MDMTNQLPYCNHCGAQQLKPDARFCHACGRPAPVMPVKTPEPPILAASQSRRLNAWWLLPLLLLAAVALVFAAWEPARTQIVALLAAGDRLVITPPTSGARSIPLNIDVTPSATPTASVVSAPTATPTYTPTPTPTPTSHALSTPMNIDIAPSATPTASVVSTPTATPTYTPPPTAAPTATPVCRIAVDGRFQALWGQQRARLGCATKQAVRSDAATERFERGRMVWRQSNDLIYVLYDDGDWTAYPDIYQEGAPEPGGFQPPEGLYVPVRGFGAIWRTKLGGAGARIGWATQGEYGLPGVFQDFEKGLMLEIEGKVYLLGDNGRRWLAP